MICDVIWYCLFYFVQRVQIERLQTMIYNSDDENTIGENKKEKTRNLKLKTPKPQNNTNRLKTKFNEENVDREKINNNNKRVLKYMHICITCISQ